MNEGQGTRERLVATAFRLALLGGLGAVVAMTAMVIRGSGREAPMSEPAAASALPKRVFMKSNALIHELSPYLLQYAHQPVQWYPWGEEAFAKARRENKPIFLSIGYSTCHWCHVMARESFHDASVARVLNEHFVAIKVDREERPDVDRVYMAYVQATTGSGGWPLSVWLTPDLKPFFGGTYYPPDERWGRPGFKALLRGIAASWTQRREPILATADNATQQLRQFNLAQSASRTAPPGRASLEAAYRQFASSYDPNDGGFGGAPKFHRPVVLNFVLRYYARTGTPLALEMPLFTLRKMAAGGLHDQLGGGFHRYSVDTFWHVPHFEKMLYDQAQMVCSYLEAYQLTRDPLYAAVARDTLDYVRRDMTGPEGQFYSAEDADSPLPTNPAKHGEGAFYVWTQADIAATLGAEAAAVFGYAYGVEKNGNAPADPHGEFVGANILIVRHSPEETAAQFGQSPERIRELLQRGRADLLALRSRRPRPQRDDKTLTGWNGLMISACARAAQALDEPGYRTAAQRAARFIEARLYDPQTGTLRRRCRVGVAAIDGFADDYAFLIQGLLDLYETSFEVHWLGWALRLQERQNANFWDEAQGAYFSTSGQDSSMILRLKDGDDGAEPSANAVAALNLLRLSQMTDNPGYRERAERIFTAFGSRLEQAPHAMPQMLVAYGFFLDTPRQIVIAGQPDAPDTQALLRAVYDRFVPNRVLLLADGGAGQQELAQRLEFIREVKPSAGQATAYLCENYACQPPITAAAELGRQLDARGR
jgi:uncharacterized protein YyaL (SSP411 family)